MSNEEKNMSAEEKTTAPAIPLEIITLPMVEDDIKNLLWDHPLFGEVLNNCTRSVSRDIPTACVTAKLQLIVNPDFYAAQGKEERRGVLSHEIFHLIMEHIPRFMSVYDTKDRNLCQIANIAMDCAINQLLPYKLPTDCITVESVRNLIKDKSIKVEEKQSAEYYYKLLKTAYDETAESMKDAIKALEEALKNGIPDHSKHFEDGKEGTEKGMNSLEKMRMEQVIANAIEKQKEHEGKKAGTSAGNSLYACCPKRVKINKTIWQNLVKNTIGDVPSDPNYKYGKASRRNPESMYGKVYEPKNLKVYVGIDSSASVDDASLDVFVSTVNEALRKLDVVVDLIHCDYAIGKVEKNLRRIPKEGFNIVGRGGTDLSKILDYIETAEKGKPARLILMTDGETPWRESESVETTVLYTQRHSKIEGIKKWAVVEV
jgi:predicted metal-dependent peptidase